MERVVLVNEQDKEIGTEEKIHAHKEGKLHRAFSIFIFNAQGELLLQKRAQSKYHCGGLWSNTCCGHPKPNEPLEHAIHRRLKEEMGIDGELRKAFQMMYKVPFDNGLTENEFLHVFVGTIDKQPVINKDEADDFKWMRLEDLKRDIKENSEAYTYWFKKALPCITS